MTTQDQYLRAILATVARQTFPADVVYDHVAVGADKAKQLQAYNLCDGNRSQADIAKTAGLDQGSFSRTVSRWIDVGIVIRIGEGRDVRLLHIYSLPESMTKKAGNKDG